ncbi:hypothetical protein A6V39_03225 [Candidatus Mycoplasma haematobovis]|uniref:Uncharacterized protein n=1 Tax=Candidatus Mycoplasma haematobovis TaxID=432608 RepID=A0A1A9QEI7_9MOLU|nr:hypothetical protein A6V39_03225 [Candidatus Mycoplasma haematobovis]
MWEDFGENWLIPMTSMKILNQNMEKEGIDSEVLNGWFNDHVSRELDEEGLFPDIYARIESRCTKI